MLVLNALLENMVYPKLLTILNSSTYFINSVTLVYNYMYYV